MAATLLLDPDEFKFSLDDLELNREQEDELLAALQERFDALAAGRVVPGVSAPPPRDRWSVLAIRRYKVVFTQLTPDEVSHHGLDDGTTGYYLLRISAR